MHARMMTELAMSVPHLSSSQKCLAKENMGGKCDSKMPWKHAEGCAAAEDENKSNVN